MGIYLWLALGRSRDARPQRPRTLVALAALAAALLLPAVALASHLFSDVPTSHTFHTNISNLAGAGVTAGCGGGKYCPDQPVTRGQMAGFLNRGLGRVAEADISTTVTGTSGLTFGSVTITPGTSPGALPGATQFVRALFTGSILSSNATNCPCRVHIYLTDAVYEPLQAYEVFIPISTAGEYHPFSTGGVMAVTGSDPVTIYLRAYISPGGTDATSLTVAGNLVAETIPFGNTGAGTLGN